MSSSPDLPITLWRDLRAATLAGDAAWGAIDNACLVVQGDRLAWVGPLPELPPEWASRVNDEVHVDNAWVTPGLVDCHTHLVYGGTRAHEHELRLQGVSYEQIARAGGGIRSTVAATRSLDEEALCQAAARRLRQLQADGVTTVEVKSGYGLSLDDERRMLRVARRLGREGMDVRSTYLALHAVPPEFDGRPGDARDGYTEAACQWLDTLHAEGLVDAVDAFCERIGFTPGQVTRLFQHAEGLGLPVKLHAEQLSDQGGAALAAEFGALSADHLEWLSEAGIQAMAQAGTVAVLLPGAYLTLKDTHLPPVAALRAAGVPMAVATDHNPGSSPALSLTLMMNLACTLFGLTPEEALRGCTHVAAKALGLHDRGRLQAGLRADFAVWDVEHPRELSYWLGHRPLLERVHAGRADGRLAA
ncbi:MAG: imidazolonepropionase [Inhella sp.]|uniref:imidazolonepropionase n=1 Tax=Inhella sp. TaxID=1921806 RepID=UPI00391F9D2D